MGLQGGRDCPIPFSPLLSETAQGLLPSVQASYNCQLLFSPLSQPSCLYWLRVDGAPKQGLRCGEKETALEVALAEGRSGSFP